MNALEQWIEFARLSAIGARQFPTGLEGLGFSEFVILYHLSQAPGVQMRRIDLADKLGLTASGVTRLLLPMEKLGLVSKEKHRRDARVSLVRLTPAGRRNMADSLPYAQTLAEKLWKRP
jgi:DNA-binding MarR family transcriptional regulator